jgi:hypothetical protein
VGEALHGNDIAVMDQGAHGFGKWTYLAHKSVGVSRTNPFILTKPHREVNGATRTLVRTAN